MGGLFEEKKPVRKTVDPNTFREILEELHKRRRDELFRKRFIDIDLDYIETLKKENNK